MSPKPTLFLRIASALTFIHAVLHTVGGVFGKPLPGAASMVVATMRANHFPVFGVTRSYADFYFGLGLAVSIMLTVESVVLWHLSTLAKAEAARLKPLIGVLMVGFLAFAVVSYVYFFSGPVVVELLIAACLAGAIVTAKPGGAFSASAAAVHA